MPQSLRTISIEFLLNLLANLKQLRIGHYLILTTQALCRRLQEDYCEYSCVWTTLWHSHPGLPKWNLKAGDMFLMWAQQWRYIARAMENGYRILRSDTDVYLAEDPYPILRGPLFSRFEMVVQHDFFGAKERPRCDTPAPMQTIDVADRIPSCGRRNPGLALLNIGLVYLRSSPGGGVYAVINGTWCVRGQRPSLRLTRCSAFSRSHFCACLVIAPRLVPVSLPHPQGTLPREDEWAAVKAPALRRQGRLAGAHRPALYAFGCQRPCGRRQPLRAAKAARKLGGLAWDGG